MMGEGRRNRLRHGACRGRCCIAPQVCRFVEVIVDESRTDHLRGLLYRDAIDGLEPVTDLFYFWLPPAVLSTSHKAAERRGTAPSIGA